MKSINELIAESNGWNPSFKQHRDAHNSFVKWYDKQLRYMNKEEILDMLKGIINDIEDDTLGIFK